MDAGQTVRIEKPAFWSSKRVLFNANGGQIGAFIMRTPFSFRRAEGEASGKTFVFNCKNISTRHSEITDEWGHTVGTMDRSGWLGVSAQIILFEKEYVWRTNMWGTHFWIEHTDGAIIVEVRGCGGFGVRGAATFNEFLPTEEALSLIYAGLYQMRLFEMEVGSTTAIVAVPLAVAV